MPENGLGMQKLKKPCELTQGLCARFVQNVDFRQKNHGKIDGKQTDLEKAEGGAAEGSG